MAPSAVAGLPAAPCSTASAASPGGSQRCTRLAAPEPPHRARPRLTAVGFVVEGRIQQLQTDQAQKKQRPHDLPRTPLRHPAIGPCRDGADEKNVEHREDRQPERHPAEQIRAHDRRAHQDAETTKPAQDGGNVHHAEDQMEQVERSKTNRESQQSVDVELLLKGSNRNRYHLPRQQQRPEQHRRDSPFSGRGDGVGAGAKTHREPESHQPVDQIGDSVRGRFKSPAAGANGIPEDAQAYGAKSPVLRAGERAERTPMMR